MIGGSAGSAMKWAQSIRARARRWAVGGLDLLYPPHCPICRREPAAADSAAPPATDPGSMAALVCQICSRELCADVGRCLKCGEPGGAADGCRLCSRRPREWRHIAVLSSYAGGLRDAVLRAKRPAGDDVAAALASLLVRKHGDKLVSWEVGRVVPVPMHWLRRSVRGTSAADELSRGIARTLGLPWSRAIVRQRATRMQNELPVADRPKNVEGAFRVCQRFEGERILLVDDVVTTGATLSACSRALLAAGAATVDVAVVAKADRGTADADA